MSDRYHNQVRLACNEIIVGFIPKGGVHEVVTDPHQQTLPDGTPNPYYLRMLVDVQALDGRGQWNGVPIQQQAGVARHYREGQVVLLAFRHMNNLLPIVIGHAVNTDGSITVANPLVLPMADGIPDWQIDDQAYVHPETGAYTRFRNVGSTPGRSLAPSAPDPARPGKWETVMNDGSNVTIEQQTDGDDNVIGVTITLLANGGTAVTSVVIDSQTGAVNVMADKVVITAPDVELGDDTGMDYTKALVRQSDIENFIRATFNEHTHPSNGAPPSQQMAEPPYSQTTYSE